MSAGHRTVRRWVATALALTLAGVLGVLGLAGWQWVQDGEPVLHLVINGEEITGSLLPALPRALWAVLGGGVALWFAVFALLAVPLALLLVAVLVGGALLAGIGLPLLALAAVALVLLSPLVLLVWLVRRALRPAPVSTTMSA